MVRATARERMRVTSERTSVNTTRRYGSDKKERCDGAIVHMIVTQREKEGENHSGNTRQSNWVSLSQLTRLGSSWSRDGSRASARDYTARSSLHNVGKRSENVCARVSLGDRPTDHRSICQRWADLPLVALRTLHSRFTVPR